LVLALSGFGLPIPSQRRKMNEAPAPPGDGRRQGRPWFTTSVLSYVKMLEGGELARRSKTQAGREMLLNMAETWEQLAAGRAKTLETQSRFAALIPDQ
jgi:hypothetical protein